MNKKQKCHVTRIGPKANENFESLDVPLLRSKKNNTDQDFQMWRGTSMLAGNALQRRNGDVKVRHLKLALRDNIAINTGLIAKQVPEQGSPLSLAYMVVDQNSFSQKWPFLEKSTLGKLHKKKNPPHPILDYEWKYA